MGKFSELDLELWQEEDLEDVFEEYPELENMSIEEMEKFARKLYWEARGYIDRATSLECKADTIRIYIQAIGK